MILNGFRLRSDARIVPWPNRYMDDRGREFWGRVMALIPVDPEEGAETSAGWIGEPCDAAQSPLLCR